MHRRYHFSLGDSTNGPLGFCATVRANSPEEALEILRSRLPQEQSLHPVDNGDGAVEYLRAYLNPDAATIADIDDESDDGNDEPAEG